jgi:hypothetical protein
VKEKGLRQRTKRRPSKIFHPASYFLGWAGVGGVGEGFAGTLFVGTGVEAGDFGPFTVSRTELPVEWREDKMESVPEVSIKMMTPAVVARDNADAAPRGPKAVWLPTPPNAPAMSALFPLCSSTTMIKKMETMM